MSNVHSILSSEFDPSLLLDPELNNPSNDDLFYKTLLNDIDNDNLRDAIANLKQTRLSLGNISHAVYLLPWSVQPKNEELESRSRTIRSISTKSIKLKKSLEKYISRIKSEAELTRALLELRLSGYLKSNNLCYKYLKRIYGLKIRVKCIVNKNFQEYYGKLSLFDRDCNILLLNACTNDGISCPFLYIKYV